MDTKRITRKRRRESIGLAVEDLARRINVRTATLYRWERGDRTPVPALDDAWERALLAAERESVQGRAS